MSPQPTADQLPGALLARILQHVPLQQRLASCALVCKSWAPAAAAATHKLSLTVRQPDWDSDDESVAAEASAADPSSISITARQPQESSLEVSGVTGWLQQHGSNLNSLQLQCITQGSKAKDVKAQLQLPCPALVQLTSLSLDGCVVSTTPQQASASVSTQALPQLVDLELRSCKFASAASFQQLAGSTSLTALELDRVWWDDSPQPQAAAGRGSQPSALAAVLQAGSGMHRLKLCYWDREEDSVCMPSSSLAVISRLQQLQDLSVFLPLDAGTPAGPPLPDLPCGLTRLVLTAGDPSRWSQATYRLSLQGLSQLRALELHGAQMFSNVGVRVSALSSMSKLQQLVIDCCILLPEAALLTSHVPALLAVVGELTLLRELKLVLDFDSGVEAVPSAAFAALTASSQLRVLHVELSHEGCTAFPSPDMLQHMFPAGQQLGQLHTLVLGFDYRYSSEWSVPLSDLARIAASCPALQTLSLVDVFKIGPDDLLCPLMDLTMLSSLRVGGATWDDSAAGVVAQLTQLTSLEWVLTQDQDALACTGLAQLAALERLQRFSVHCDIVYDAREETPRLEEDLGFLPDLAASEEDGPVWVQILELLKVPERFVKTLQRQQRHDADMQELQHLRSRVAELEHRA